MRAFPPPEDDWWTSREGKGMCRMCGEERLVHEIVDFRGIQHFCKVCGNSWWVNGKQQNWRE